MLVSLRALLLVPLAWLAACATQGPKLPVGEFERGELSAALTALRSELGHCAPEDQALVLNVLGQCEMLVGERESAWQHFELAGRMMGNWQTGSGEALAAIVGSEGSKTYKGDPHEKGMNAFYAGLHYLWRGEPDNARACFKRGILADGEIGEDKFRVDNALLLWLAGRASSLMGLAGEAEDYLREAREADAFAREQGAVGDAAEAVMREPQRGNVVVLVESGKGPVKYRSGEYGQLAKYRAGDDAVTRVTLRVDGRELGTAPPLLDLRYQATTMGGTAMEGIRQGKAVFKDVSSKSGVVLLHHAATGGFGDSDKGRATAAVVGGALLALGALTRAEADVRHWPTLPAYVHALPLSLPPGPHELELRFTRADGAVVSGLDQRATIDVPKTGEAYFYFRGIPCAAPAASKP